MSFLSLSPERYVTSQQPGARPREPGKEAAPRRASSLGGRRESAVACPPRLGSVTASPPVAARPPWLGQETGRGMGTLSGWQLLVSSSTSLLISFVGTTGVARCWLPARTAPGGAVPNEAAP